MSAAALLAGAVERACNQALALDPEVAEGLAEHDGRVIAVEVVGIASFTVCIEGERVRVAPPGPDDDPEPDLRVAGTPGSLLALARAEGAAGAVEGVTVRGDALLAQSLGELARRLRIDWEEGLARLVGDAPAREAGRAARAAAGWTRAAAAKLLADSDEYLREEVRLVAGRSEIDSFAREVDAARDDVERLEARIGRLEAARRGER